jgi:uncharacterized protein (TIGR02996 family)
MSDEFGFTGGEEAAFLRAIEAHPGDEERILVYAAWLEERGDARGEYLRLEGQLLEIPRRLAQLREQIDPAWLAAVGGRRKVVLLSYPATRKIEVIKIVREVTGLGLKEAKDLVERDRPTLAEDLTRDKAEQLVRRFDGVAMVVTEPSGNVSAPGAGSAVKDLGGVGSRKVVLVSYPPVNKISVIKVVRELTGLGLAEAKDLVERDRPTIKSGLTGEVAEHVARYFDGIAEVVIEAGH